MRRLILLAVPIVSACGLVVIGSQSWFEQYGKNSVVERAAFDLNCPKEQIATVPLGTNQYTQVGVRGCNKKATFVYATGSGAWTRNSEIQTETAELPNATAKTGPM